MLRFILVGRAHERGRSARPCPTAPAARRPCTRKKRLSGAASAPLTYLRPTPAGRPQPSSPHHHHHSHKAESGPAGAALGGVQGGGAPALRGPRVPPPRRRRPRRRERLPRPRLPPPPAMTRGGARRTAYWSNTSAGSLGKHAQQTAYRSNTPAHWSNTPGRPPAPRWRRRRPPFGRDSLRVGGPGDCRRERVPPGLAAPCQCRPGRPQSLRSRPAGCHRQQ